MYDFEHSVNEERFIAIGKVGDILLVVFTERRENIRLISARLATAAERQLNYDQDRYNLQGSKFNDRTVEGSIEEAYGGR